MNEIDSRNLIDSYNDYIEQYLNTVFILLDCKRIQILPLIFNYTHFAELIIKSIDHFYDGYSENWTIKELGTDGHDLIKILENKEIVETFVNLDISLNLISSIKINLQNLKSLTGFYDINNNSRYPVNKNNDSIDINKVNKNKDKICILIIEGLKLLLDFYINGTELIIINLERKLKICEDYLKEAEQKLNTFN